MIYKSVLFDLDGTLLNTIEDIADAVNRALKSLSFPVHPVESYKEFVGDGITVLAKRVLPKEEQTSENIAKCLEAINKEYKKGLLIKTKPYNGILDLLKNLIQKKIPIGIVSNKPHELTVHSVKKIFSDINFSVVLGEQNGIPHKPDPAMVLKAAKEINVDPQLCVYVGDSGIDMKTAVLANMYPVGVLWGFRTKEELLANGARLLVEHPLEILKKLF
jgi:phosphoglycolate phosphatase